MNCIKCGMEINSTTDGNYICPNCGTEVYYLADKPQNCGSKKGKHNMKGFIEVLNEDNNKHVNKIVIFRTSSKKYRSNKKCKSII